MRRAARRDLKSGKAFPSPICNHFSFEKAINPYLRPSLVGVGLRRAVPSRLQADSGERSLHKT